MATPSVTNFLASSDLNVVELVDPSLIDLYATSLGEQINTFRMGYLPQKRVLDLSRWIADIIIETTAQGSSLLEVHIIDPALSMFVRDSKGACFIDVDDSGYLWPPVEVTFPKDTSDATWRLCQAAPSTDLTQPNVVLTFEDKIVSELREQFRQQVSYPNQTRAEFMQDLVRQANQNPAYPGEVDIRFVHLLPKETFAVADLSMQQRIPASATQKYVPPARKNPNKLPLPPGAGAEAGGSALINPFAGITQTVAQSIQNTVEGVDISIQTVWDAFLHAHGSSSTPVTPAPAAPPTLVFPNFGGG